MKKKHKSFAIIGLGRFGLAIIENLSQLTNEVLAIDIDEKAVTRASEYVNNCFVCNATNINNLKELGVANIDHAIVAIGDNVTDTILTIIALKELKVPRITVRVDDEYYIPVMKKIGADSIVLPEKAAAISLAYQIVSNTVLDYYNIANDYGICEIEVGEKFEEISLVDMNSQNRFDVSIVIVRRNNEVLLPKANLTIRPKDKILVVGKNSKIAKFDEYINE